MGEFRDKYYATKPGPAREALVFDYAIRQGKPKTVPITVPGPGGTKITYQVMPDFLMIDGIRVSLTPVTAQRIADHFGMSIPTQKMADQIYHNSNQISARPLSGTGVTIGGRHYTGNDVVSNLISDSRANIAYSEIVDQQIAAQKGADPNKPVDGFAKTIVQPEVPGRAGFYGLWTSPTSKPIQGGSGLTPHGLDQTEYGTFARFVAPNVTITTTDGRTISTTLDRVLSTPNISSALTSSPGTGVRRYTQLRAGPPPGYRSARLDPSVRSEAESKAKALLNRPMYTEVQLTLSNGQTVIAKIEPHSNAPKGVSLYERVSGTQPSTPSATPAPSTTPGTPIATAPPKPKDVGIMQKITDFIKSLDVGLG
jgi:small nuclear ribonucleoprotein (snRNP)-like protein